MPAGDEVEQDQGVGDAEPQGPGGVVGEPPHAADGGGPGELARPREAADRALADHEVHAQRIVAGGHGATLAVAARQASGRTWRMPGLG